MTVDPEIAWRIAQHLAELTAAHALLEMGKTGVRKGAGAAVEWLKTHLTGPARETLATLTREPESGEAKVALAQAISTELQARPALLAEARALLAEAGEMGGMTQIVGDDARAIQTKGDNNQSSISG